MADATNRKFSTEYFIDGSPLYEPDADGGVQPEWNSLAAENSGRTQDGIMHIKWLFSNLPKYKFSYNALTKDQLLYMRNLVQGKTFMFTCPDGTFEAYCSTTGTSQYSSYFYGGLYRDFKFDIIATGK